jgi:hypothetical protein
MVANAGGAISLSLGNTKMSTGVTRGDQATGISRREGQPYCGTVPYNTLFVVP